MADDFAARYAGLLAGSYDCVDRIVLNAYYPMGNTAGGFRTWWRRLIGGSDADADAVLDNTHLMRLAGRFARRVRAWAADNAVPVIDCPAGERKHLIAEEYLRTHSVGPGVFMILVSRAPAMIWDVRRSADGTVIGNLARKRTYVNHYSFHIMDSQWGHLTIKMAGHAPFGAQVLLNGHEYVAVGAQGEGIFTKEGNCFTGTTDPAGLAQIADTLSQDAAAGRLSQVINRWIYTACQVFGLDLADQQRTCFIYAYSVYQVEYSRNLLFACGRQMQDIFDAVVDRTRSRLDVPQVTTLFGAKMRPRTARGRRPPRLEVVIETPAYDLTKFKVHFGNLTLKGYTKGERVLRFEGIAHNTKDAARSAIISSRGRIADLGPCRGIGGHAPGGGARQLASRLGSSPADRPGSTAEARCAGRCRGHRRQGPADAAFRSRCAGPAPRVAPRLGRRVGGGNGWQGRSTFYRPTRSGRRSPFRLAERLAGVSCR